MVTITLRDNRHFSRIGFGHGVVTSLDMYGIEGPLDRSTG
jgi:hypothetical protein